MCPDPQDPQSARTVVVSGATGLVGRALVESLRARGHRVRRLLRTARDLSTDDVVWDPSVGPVPPEALVDADAVVNLAGEPVAHRWTSERKHAIRESRVRTTAMLAQAITKATSQPRVFVNGSAVGYSAIAATRCSTSRRRPAPTSSPECAWTGKLQPRPPPTPASASCCCAPAS
jgi:Predicted nucleoside-diphosphate sugar epimerase